MACPTDTVGVEVGVRVGVKVGVGVAVGRGIRSYQVC